VLRKKDVYTNITPIPSHIPRQLAIDILHSHSEIITLNPLVTGHQPTKPPRNAEADEFYATWYEIAERVQFVPGLGKMGSGQITFKGCFHDMPWGLQTHILAPMSVDLRNNWRIAGTQPGEPSQTREMGIGAPAEGLYLREDIEIRCNITLVSFVKAQLKAASKVLVDRLVKKAELIDSGTLIAMMENGKLKTINPADRSDTAGPMSPVIAAATLQSPRLQYQRPQQNILSQHPPDQHYAQYPDYKPVPPVIQPMELPGDYPHPSPASLDTPKPSPGHPRHSAQLSEYSHGSPDPQWADPHSQGSSRPTSYSSDTSGFRSPGLPGDHKGYAAELPAVGEAREE
ncbi:hypothetical protein P152DRAFT_384906, partial [Eremomyces bilateralis CBS 781.70]